MTEQFIQTPLGTLRLCGSGEGVERMDFVEADSSAGVQELPWAGGGKVVCVPSGTDFQRAVWTAMAEIPHGETATYGELAARIGRPGSSRAVGSAVRANPLAVLLPCHRVLPAGGGLGGFRWGLERKRQFLDWEAHGRDVLQELCGVPASRFQFCLDHRG